MEPVLNTQFLLDSFCDRCFSEFLVKKGDRLHLGTNILKIINKGIIRAQ